MRVLLLVLALVTISNIAKASNSTDINTCIEQAMSDESGYEVDFIEATDFCNEQAISDFDNSFGDTIGEGEYYNIDTNFASMIVNGKIILFNVADNGEEVIVLRSERENDEDKFFNNLTNKEL